MSKIKITFVIIFIFLSYCFTNFVYASDLDGIDVNLNVITCNNNGVCEAGAEDFLSCPVDCLTPITTGGTSSGGVVNFTAQDFFRNLVVTPSYTSANIKWNSIIPTIYILKWGTTGDYKDGTLKNVHFVNDHSVEISNLTPDTIYYFTIEAQSYIGKTNTINNQSFKTLIPQDKIAPGNVTDVNISTTISGIVLSWVNPLDKDFDYVRIVRNTDKYSSDPYSGKLVYEGSGQYFRDTNVEVGQKYFYTIFAKDKSGNFSSGSLVSITHNPPKDGIPKIDTQIDTGELVVTPLDSVLYSIVQNDIKKDFNLGSTTDINGGKSFVIVAKFNEINKNLLWVQIRRDTDRKIVGRYLFGGIDGISMERIVVVPPIKGNGYYSASIFRYNDNGDEQLIHQAGLQVKTLEEKKERGTSWLLLILLLILLIIIVLAYHIFFHKIMPRVLRRFMRKREK